MTEASRLPGPDWLDVSRVLAALAAGVAAMGATYAVVGAARGYLLDSFAGLLANYTPAIIFRFLRNDLGSTLQVLLAGSMAVLSVAVLVLLGAWAAAALDRQWLAAPLGAVFAAAGAGLVTLTVLPAIAAGVAAGVVVAVGESVAALQSRPETTAGRRRVLAGVATAAGIGLVGRFVGRGKGLPTAEDLPASDKEEAAALLSEADRKSFDVSGIEPLVSQNFYNVDINPVDPMVDVAEWTLTVTGEVERRVTYDYDEFRDLESEHRFVSLRCVSDTLDGEALDNALWTGVPVDAILEEAGPTADWVLLKGADDYEVGFPLEALRGGLLAYGMNGKVLPQAHGYPVRALVPGHWGETNAKWITEIEVTQKEIKGYWEKKGWAGTGPVHTIAKLHDSGIEKMDDGRIRLAGHAYAGLRGISGVEVSTDGGDTWAEATLSEPLPGEDVWRQWRFEYDSPGESHEVVVRAVEADGTVQPQKQQDKFPSGATGWVHQTVEV